MEPPDPKAAVDAVRDNLEKVRRAMIRGGARGLYKGGELIITDAKDNYVPVRDGILRASGFVQQPEITDDDATVTIGFGGAAEAYALEQHERLDFQHPHGGGPKYLERPVMAHGQDVRDLVAEEMRAEVGALAL